MMFLRIKNALAKWFPQFARIPMERRVDADLYHARVDLLNAQHNAEHWNAMQSMYAARVARLEGLERTQTTTTQGSLNLVDASRY